MSLHADLALRLGPLDLSVQIDAAPAEIVAVVGPNGAGKTTLLRALAGLVPIADGRITLGSLMLDDTDVGNPEPSPCTAPSRRAAHVTSGRPRPAASTFKLIGSACRSPGLFQSSPRSPRQSRPTFATEVLCGCR
jgi:energy-coupling factor transporter ATP-binding protein EcfA2